MTSEKAISALSDKKKIKYQTHVHQQNKFLKRVPVLVNPQYLTVIYLYNNDIEKIENLESAINVHTLHLHHNKIKLIQNLNKLTKLKKLFLGHNEITVVENLEDNIYLEELHIEKQSIKKCDAMCFDPRTIYALAASLQILNITQNNIKSIYALMPLSALRILHAGKNKINEVGDIKEAIQYWYFLYEANFAGNPVTKKHRYREKLIAHTMRLSMLDGKQISHNTRTFVRNFEEEKKMRLQNGTVNLPDVYPNLPNNYPIAIQEAVSASIVNKELCDIKITNHISWKQIPKRKLPIATRKRMVKRNPKPDNLNLGFPMNL